MSCTAVLLISMQLVKVVLCSTLFFSVTVALLDYFVFHFFCNCYKCIFIGTFLVKPKLLS